MFVDSGLKIKCNYENSAEIQNPLTRMALQENQRGRTGNKTLKSVEGSPITMLFNRNAMKFDAGTIVSVTPVEFEGKLIRPEFYNYIGKKTCFPMMHENSLIICKEVPENPNDVVWTPFLTKTIKEALEGNYCIPDMGPENSMPYGTTIFYYRTANMNVSEISFAGTIYEVECEQGFSLVMEETYIRDFGMESGRIMSGNKSEYKEKEG